jgi:hypothetical protein
MITFQTLVDSAVETVSHAHYLSPFQVHEQVHDEQGVLGHQLALDSGGLPRAV